MAIVKQGSVTLNSGAKGDKGDSGGASPFIKAVTSQLELTEPLDGKKELSIQANFTLSSDVIIPDGAILSDGGGVITVGANTITFQNNSFKSDYNRTFIDLGQNGTINAGTITNGVITQVNSTYTNADINLAWFGLVFDGVEGEVGGATQSGTDNRNVIIQAQKIYNFHGKANVVIKGEGTGKFAMSEVEKTPFAGNEPAGMYITGTVNMTFGEGITKLSLPNNISNYESIAIWKADGGSLIGGRIVGDLVNHTYVGQYDEGCHGVVIKSTTKNFTFRPDLIKNFSGDGAVATPVFDAIYSTSSENGVDENSFIPSGSGGDGGAKDTFVDELGVVSVNTDFATSGLFDVVTNTRWAEAALVTLGGDVSNGGQSGFKGNTVYFAFYDATAVDGNFETGFIERTGLVDTYSLIPLKDTYESFRLVIPTPDVWGDVIGTIYAPKFPNNVTWSPKKIEWCRRQGISNPSPYSKIKGIHFDDIGRDPNTNAVGSPAYAIDIEDSNQFANNIEISGNTFGNTARGSIILKGSKYININNNIFPYPTIPDWADNIGIVLHNGHETILTENTISGQFIQLGRRDVMSNNRLKDTEIQVRLEGEVISNETNAVNVNFITNSTATGTGMSYYRDNHWEYDKPLDGTPIFNHRELGNIVRQNEVFDLQNQISDNFSTASATGNSGVCKGYVDNVTIKNIAIPSTNIVSSLTWLYQPLKDFNLDCGLTIRIGEPQDIAFENLTLKGPLYFRLDGFPTSTGVNIPTLTIKNPEINIVTAESLNSAAYAFYSHTTNKDLNIAVEGGSVNILIGDNANANKFFDWNYTGTKTFTGVTFYTDHSTPQVQALDASYEFINCTFNNITFTGATITTTTSGADGLSAYEVAVADGFAGTESQWLASLVGTTGATGATGSATGAMNLGFIQYETFDESGTTQGKAIIDVINETINIEAYSISILKNGTSSGDRMRLNTPTTTQSLDFSVFLTSNVVVYLVWNDATGLFEIGSSLADFTNDADHFFITSFRRFVGQTDVKLSFNQHGFRIISSSPEYITKWTILGDSHTVGGLWINEAARLHGKINERLPLGVSGSTVADVLGNSFYDRRTQITTDTDLLTIFGGTNDYEQSATVGTVQDGGVYTVTTTIGSLQEIIEYAYSQNPAMKINLMTPVYHLDANTGGVQYDVSAYTDAFQAVGDYYNIPVLHLNSEMGINKYNYAEWMNTGETKPIHFNDYGREKVGRIVKEFIKANY